MFGPGKRADFASAEAELSACFAVVRTRGAAWDENLPLRASSHLRTVSIAPWNVLVGRLD
jgi:hypothetical protein